MTAGSDPRRGSRGPRGKRGPGKGSPRKAPPPESTGIEAEYLAVRKEQEVPMVVELLDGKAVRGVIRYFDRDMIKVEGDEGPGLFIRKRDIRHIRRADPD